VRMLQDVALSEFFTCSRNGKLKLSRTIISSNNDCVQNVLACFETTLSKNFF
jgi:hypothetical protein